MNPIGADENGRGVIQRTTISAGGSGGPTMRLDEEKLVLKLSSDCTQQSTIHDGDPWGKKVSPGGTVMWAGGCHEEIDAVAESSNNQRVWERLPVEVKRTGNPEEVIVCVCVFFNRPCARRRNQG